MLTPDVVYPLESVTKDVVFLKNIIKSPDIIVGDYTYYHDYEHVDKFEEKNVLFLHNCKLILGKFCQLAHGTTFLMQGANHQMDGFSTYPFFIFGGSWNEYNVNLPVKGDTVVGHDVWFGHKSFIMPGVNIGSGAIIAANSVVTKDVEPYTIVGGNPARVIRKRFPNEVIEQLLEIAWWDWDYEKVTEKIAAIVGGDVASLRV